MEYPGYTNTTPLFPFFPPAGGYSGNPGSVLAGGVRNPAHNVANTIMSIGNPSYPALKTSHPLRISTHPFHRSADVDGLVAALLATVPRP